MFSTGKYSRPPTVRSVPFSRRQSLLLLSRDTSRARSIDERRSCAIPVAEEGVLAEDASVAFDVFLTFAVEPLLPSSLVDAVLDVSA